MESVTLNLPDKLASQINEAAKKIGISTEEFIKSGIEEKLSLLDRDFHKAVDRESHFIGAKSAIVLLSPHN